MNGFCVILITVGKKEVGKKIAHILVAEKLVGCVNVISQVDSIFWWEGKIEETSEAVLIGKTKIDLVDLINNRIKEIHPNEVFELLALPVAAGGAEYFRWLEESLRA